MGEVSIEEIDGINVILAMRVCNRQIISDIWFKLLAFDVSYFLVYYSRFDGPHMRLAQKTLRSFN